MWPEQRFWQVRSALSDTQLIVFIDVNAGADMINDVSAGSFDPAMLGVVAELGVPFIAMHSRGTPSTMTGLTDYTQDVAGDVAQELQMRLDQIDAVLPRWLQIVDPGVGFAKGLEQNLSVLQPDHLKLLKHALGDRPMLVGASRKKFIATILNNDRDRRLIADHSLTAQQELTERDLGTSGACCAALLGGADILRVHNVAMVNTVCSVFCSVVNGNNT